MSASAPMERSVTPYYFKTVSSRLSFLSALGCFSVSGAITPDTKKTTRAAAVLHVSGDVDVSVRDEFAAAVRAALEPAPRPLIVSLGKCTFLDCSAVAVLVKARRRAGSRLQIVVPAESRLRRIFGLLELTGPLQISATLREATLRARTSGEHFA